MHFLPPPRTQSQMYKMIFQQSSQVNAFLFFAGNQLMNLGDLQLLWENAILKIKMVISQQMESSIKQPKQHLKLKEIVSLFRSAVEQCGLFVRPLMEYLFNTRKEFEKLLAQRLQGRIKAILDKEKFSPMTIKSTQEYNEKLVPCGLEIPLKRVKKRTLFIVLDVCVSTS